MSKNSENDRLLMEWKSISEQLQDPATGTVHSGHAASLIDIEISYCNNTNIPLSLIVLELPGIPVSGDNKAILSSFSLIKDIADKIKNRLHRYDILFYDGCRSFWVLCPKSEKKDIRLTASFIESDIKNIHLDGIPISIKGGYAELPSDACDAESLKNRAYEALRISASEDNSGITGYFNEQRKHIRIPLEVEVRYDSLRSDSRITCSRNISESGIKLSGLPDLDMEIPARLGFTIPCFKGIRIDVEAKHVWNSLSPITGKMDMGLCFIRVNDTARTAIRNFTAKTFYQPGLM